MLQSLQLPQMLTSSHDMTKFVLTRYNHANASFKKTMKGHEDCRYIVPCSSSQSCLPFGKIGPSRKRYLPLDDGDDTFPRNGTCHTKRTNQWMNGEARALSQTVRRCTVWSACFGLQLIETVELPDFGSVSDCCAVSFFVSSACMSIKLKRRMMYGQV